MLHDRKLLLTIQLEKCWCSSVMFHVLHVCHCEVVDIGQCKPFNSVGPACIGNGTCTCGGIIDCLACTPWHPRGCTVHQVVLECVCGDSWSAWKSGRAFSLLLVLHLHLLYSSRCNVNTFIQPAPFLLLHAMTQVSTKKLCLHKKQRSLHATSWFSD